MTSCMASKNLRIFIRIIRTFVFDSIFEWGNLFYRARHLKKISSCVYNSIVCIKIVSIELIGLLNPFKQYLLLQRCCKGSKNILRCLASIIISSTHSISATWEWSIPWRASFFTPNMASKSLKVFILGTDFWSQLSKWLRA